jgi:hypothetical protein
MAGLPALLLQAAWGARRVTSHIAYAEAGLVIASVAGMLNILAMLDAHGWSERLWLTRAQERAAGPAEAPAVAEKGEVSA